MKIIELISEQGTVGTVGSTTGMTQPIGQAPTISQNPKQPSNIQADPKMKQLVSTLTAKGIAKNPSEVSDFISAYSAKKANPNQEISDPKQANMIAKLAVAKDPNLSKEIDRQLQSLSKNNQMGQAPTL